MRLLMYLYTRAETKSINSAGLQIIPGESSFPLSFPAAVAVLDLRQGDHTCSATSSSVLKAGGVDYTSSITGGQKGLVLFLR